MITVTGATGHTGKKITAALQLDWSKGTELAIAAVLCRTHLGACNEQEWNARRCARAGRGTSS
jgi:hypothetical protein